MGAVKRKKGWGGTLALVIFAYCYLMANTQAATLVSGSISTSTTWTLALSPYQVTADVTIDNGATLSIEAGTVIYFDGGKSLAVTSGALSARGTAGQPIIFTSAFDITGGVPAAGNWGQIRFLDGTNDNATIVEHALIRFGQGVSVQAASPTFNSLQISQNLGAAISIDLNSSPKGVGNQATGNTLNGISVPAGDLLGNVTWGIKGIPYVVSSGTVSVGMSPLITSVTPPDIQQGSSVDTVIFGTRLTGADAIRFDSAGLSAVLTGSGSDTSLPLRITSSATQPLGNVPFDLKTSAGWVRYVNGLSVIPLKPTISLTSIVPGSMRRGETKSFQISGNSLLGAQVSTPSGAGLTLNNLLTTSTSANFNLIASATATLGTQPLSVTNPMVANGVAAMLVNIVDAIPKINTNTIPSAVIPDGVARPFLLSITNSDTVDHSFSLSALDPTIISVSPTAVTIPAGATSASITIAGLKLGYTTLNITSPTLAAVSKQIYASTLLNGAVVGPVLSSTVGIAVPNTMAGLSGTVLPVASKVIGVSVPYVTSTLLPIGAVVPVTSNIVGVTVPYEASLLLPKGAVVPVASSAVGVDVPNSLLALPIGTSVGPTLSPVVGVTVP